MIHNIISIALFGALGASLRYLIGLLPRFFDLPTGTILVNLIGSLILGILSGWSWEEMNLSSELKIGLMTGFLGSFTTFSTFSVENIQLIQQGDLQLALFNIGLQLGLGLGLAFIGIHLGTQFSS